MCSSARFRRSANVVGLSSVDIQKSLKNCRTISRRRSISCLLGEDSDVMPIWWLSGRTATLSATGSAMVSTVSLAAFGTTSLSRALQFSHAEGLERINYFGILFVIVESKETDGDAVSSKICNNEAVFLKRLQVLFHLKMPRRRGPDAAERRRPPSVSGAKRPRQDNDNRILTKIEAAAAMHATFGNGVKVTTNDEWNAGGHCCNSFHEPIVLFEPPALPIRLRN